MQTANIRKLEGLDYYQAKYILKQKSTKDKQGHFMMIRGNPSEWGQL